MQEEYEEEMERVVSPVVCLLLLLIALFIAMTRKMGFVVYIPLHLMVGPAVKASVKYVCYLLHLVL